MRTTDTHVYFWGSYLSNFYWQIFNANIEGIDYVFHSSEQYYMAIKALHFNDEISFRRIMDAHDARAAKAIGRTVEGFDAEEWNAVSYAVMFRACMHKFNAGIIIREQLLDTGDRILVEASPMDKIWGVGLHEGDDAILDENNWLGENRLGKVLMDVRSELRAKYT